MALPPLPPGLKPLHHQVAGHKYGEGKTGLGCLQSPDGLMLKPVQRAPKGPREQSFYETMNSEKILSDSSLLKLREFLPNYFGTYQDHDNVYMKLEDCASKYNKPCIMDVKMGGILYHPKRNDLSEADLEAAYKKFPPGVEYGYSMLGMRTYDPNLGDYVVLEKSYLRKLQHEEIIISKGLESFFNKCGHRRNALVKSALDKTQEIHDWFERQSQLTFYSSSLLYVYEGDPSPIAKVPNRNSHKNGDEVCSEKESYDCSSICNNGDDATKTGEILINSGKKNGHSEKRNNCVSNGLTAGMDKSQSDIASNGSGSSDEITIKMIDFTHTYFENKKDDNYLLGLRTLIKHFKMMLQK
ncbi:inositol polyphosphate multikinase-like [Lineus longissimus]|uniref:inositol polyphosphate multikinase-like n=1 Tax=Lineus longissimus TaxID=88925 RepID=UPI002B4E48E3